MVRIRKEITVKNKRHFLQNLFTGEKKLTVIIGISKNAGKTTLLNWILKHISSATVGVLTTGRDGESKDIVGGHIKPKAYLPQNTYFTTFASILRNHSSGLEVIERLPYKSVGKELWLCRALRNLELEIIGPPTVTQQISIAETMLAHGAQHVFIDGSLDRRSIARAAQIDSLLVAVSPEFGNKREIMSELNKLSQLSSIPRAETTIEDPEYLCYRDDDGFHTTKIKSVLHKKFSLDKYISSDWIYLPGAITDAIFKPVQTFIQAYDGDIIIRHPFNLHLEKDKLQRLMEMGKIKCLHRLNIDGIAVNSYSVSGMHLDCEELREDIRKSFDIPVVDVAEVH